MTEEPVSAARLNHVTQAGELVFTIDGRSFLVEVDETLHQAIAKADRILAREEGYRTTHAHQPTLPIPQIQSLIRAGAEPQQVAQRFNLSIEQVHRFSTSVQTEKNFAVQQFLRVRAPKESGVHTLSDLVERALASMRVRTDSVQWNATRRGVEPWRIIATFTYEDRPVTATWSWNMHGNAVVCENDAACRLLCERVPDESDPAGALSPQMDMPTNLPGDSPLSARIEMAVSELHSEQERQVAQQRDAMRMAASRQAETQRAMRRTGTAGPAPRTVTPTPVVTTAAVPDSTAVENTSTHADQPAASEPVSSALVPTSSTETASSTTNSDEQPSTAPSAASASPSPEQPKIVQSTESQEPVQPAPRPNADQTATEETPRVDTAKTTSEPAKSTHKSSRRSSRNPMPSWDEIMFGA